MNKKSVFILFVVLIFSVGILNSQDKTTGFPVLKGPYLGQKPPGMTPEIFAPGIVSTGFSESHAYFSPDGKDLYYMLWGPPYNIILHMKEEKNGWTKPEIAPFFKKYDEKFSLSPDWKTIIIGSHRERPDEGDERHQKIAPSFMIRKNKSGWGEPVKLKESINGPKSLASSGNLYFSTPFNKGFGKSDIYLSRLVDGKYEDPVNLGELINTSDSEYDPCIAPDESFLVFCRRVSGFGGHDMFISFKNKDNSWTKAKNMGKRFNSTASELSPHISADGKYLFFISNRRLSDYDYNRPLTYEDKVKILNNPGNGSADIYWVDIKAVKELEPKDLK